LVERDLDVTCVDTLITGSLGNVASLEGHPRFRFLQGDVTQPLPDSIRPDLIFHLASPASVPDYLGHPLETLRVNSVGTLAMLELARQCDARFLFTSTSEIYGNPMVHPQPETYWGNVNPNGLRACYDESKRLGEAATFVYARSYGLDARVVRIFNTYGPHSRSDDGRIVPNFVMQALRDEPLTVYGDGSQTRSYCYVADLVGGIEAAMFHPNSRGEVFNLGNPDEYTVLEFARIVANAVGSSAGIEYRPLPVDDPERRCPDISKAQRVLEWEPRVSLAEGIGQTIAWFRQQLEMPQPV